MGSDREQPAAAKVAVAMSIASKVMDPERTAASLESARIVAQSWRAEHDPDVEEPDDCPDGHDASDLAGWLWDALALADHWEAEAKRLMGKAIQLHRSQGAALDMGERWHDQALDAKATIAALQDWEELAKLAQADTMRWRARCPVEASDVEAAGVTDVHLVRWLHTKGWHRSGTEKTTRLREVEGYASTLTTWRAVPRTAAGVSVPDTSAPADIAEAIRTMAHHLDMDRWTILDEMAAMDPA